MKADRTQEHSGNESKHPKTDLTLCRSSGTLVNLGRGDAGCHFSGLYACVSAPTSSASCNLHQFSYISLSSNRSIEASLQVPFFQCHPHIPYYLHRNVRDGPGNPNILSCLSPLLLTMHWIRNYTRPNYFMLSLLSSSPAVCLSVFAAT